MVAQYFTCYEFGLLEGVRHGFFSRKGGVSEGVYASLNAGLGSQDDTEHVIENWSRVMDVFGLEATDLRTLFQVHSADVVVVDEASDWTFQDRPQADALVTKQRDVALGVLTADCGAVLFSDPEAGVIGAAHAGWKGAIRGVLEQTVDAMEQLGAQRTWINATLGPCIHQKSYEVGEEFYRGFLQDDPENEQFFIASSRDAHYRFDLPRYILMRLKRMSLFNVTWVDMDTCSDAEHFFSYRRATLQGDADFGRLISVIVQS